MDSIRQYRQALFGLSNSTEDVNTTSDTTGTTTSIADTVSTSSTFIKGSYDFETCGASTKEFVESAFARRTHRAREEPLTITKRVAEDARPQHVCSRAFPASRFLTARTPFATVVRRFEGVPTSIDMKYMPIALLPWEVIGASRSDAYVLAAALLLRYEHHVWNGQRCGQSQCNGNGYCALYNAGNAASP